MPSTYVDCDGHVMEKTDELINYVGEPFKTTGHMNPRRMLPSLDRFHTPRLEERKPGTFDPNVGPEKWLQFLEKTGLESSVLYPTEGWLTGKSLSHHGRLLTPRPTMIGSTPGICNSTGA
jgi:hypothetical protein